MAIFNEKVKENFQNIEKMTGEPVWENLIQLYIKNTDQMMDDLDELLMEVNTEAIGGLAKMLKASCDHVGAEDLSVACAKLENAACEDVSFNVLQDLVDELQEQYKITKAEIQKK